MADSYKPNHILMTADTVGGVWTYSVELARALCPRGTRVSLATMGAPLADWQWAEARSVPGLEVYESSYPLEWQDEPWQGVDEASAWLLGLASRLRPDVVHVNGYSHAALAWDSPVVTVAHSCVCSWWRAVKNEPAPERYAEYRRRVRAGLQASTVTVAPSAAMLGCVVEEYDFSGEALIVPNGRNAALFRPAAQKRNYILATGRLWDEAKNIAALDRIAESLSWPVLLAGKERDPHGRRANLQRLRPLGRLGTHELSAHFAEASIYVHPARYEPFGLSVLEAALGACALVLSDIPSLREIWGDAALYVAPGDDAGLADTLERVIRSGVLRDDLGARARLRARRFSPERMAAGYLEAYGRAARRFGCDRRAAA